MTSPLDEKALAEAHDAFYATESSNSRDMMRNAIRAYLSATALPDGMEVVAWLHTLHMDGGETAVRLARAELDRPWGKPGIDFDRSFTVTIEPLVTLSQAQSALAAMRVERDRNATEYETVLNSYAEENQRLHDRAEAAEQQARDRKEGLERIAAIKYPAADTHYALKATIDYARDQARLLLKEGGE